jgi:hypothetical protein
VRSVWLSFVLETISIVRYKILRSEVEEHYFILIMSIELSVKSSKQSIETVNLLKTGNKVVEDTVK